MVASFCVFGSMLVPSVQALAAGPPPKAAVDAFAQGRYDDAKSALDPVVQDKEDVQGRLLMAQIKMRTGKYAEAAALIKKASSNAEEDADKIRAATLQGELEALRGQYDRARKTWQKVLDDFPEAAERRQTRLKLGELLLMLGQKDKATALLDAFADDYNAGHLQDSAGLTMVGVAVWRLEYYEDANSVLQEATEKDPNNTTAFVVWGDLFAEKYNSPDAGFAYQAALKVNPNLPEALVGMARVHLESDRDLDAAKALIDKALAVNPLHMDAAVLKAELRIDVEDYDGAIEILKKSLKNNPNHLAALNLLATCHYLKDDNRAFERVRRQAFKLHPRWAGFYTTVARFGVRVHRYQEAIDLNKKALALDSSYWPAFVELGIGYTRIGDDEKGFEYLLKAHENDPFNVRAFNMVNLYEQTMPSYVFVDRGPMRFRFHKSEREVLEALVPDLAGEAFGKLKKRYKFSPPEQVSVEIFRDVETFSIRSVGLPHISPHGICFGRVVTSRSPAKEPFNWAEVIWHELAHVFHIQMSRSRVPRWFTEGVAEYEASGARPEWRREQDREMVSMLRDDRIWSVGELNLGFTQAETIYDIINAYYQSTLVIEFIVDRWGFDSILKMLEHYKNSKTTAQALKAVTKMDIKAFDAAFEAYLKQRYAVLLNSFDPHPSQYANLERFEKAAAAAPRSAKAQAEWAMALFVNRRIDEAETAFKKALRLDPEEPLAHYLASLYALRIRDYRAAGDHLKSISKGGHDGYAPRLLMAELARGQNDVGAAINHYSTAVTYYPQGVEAYHALHELHDSVGDKVQAAAALERVTLLDQMDYETAMKLAQMLREAGDVPGAVLAAGRALNIHPFSGEVHLLYGELALEANDAKAAARSLDMALKLLPQRTGRDRADVYLKLAQARIYAGDRKGARVAVENAATTDPSHPDLDKIRRLLE